MKNVSILLSMVLILNLNQSEIKGSTIQPVERNVGRLNISIDPRMELLATVQLLSKYPFINRELPYSGEILTHFAPFSKHRAVRLTNRLRMRGFTFDAPITFMLHLSQPPELEPKLEFSDNLSRRSGRRNNLENYRIALKTFVENSNFEAFWDSKTSFYNQILDLTIAELGEKDLIKALEDYFNESKENYNVIITPTFIGGKGPSIPDADGNVRIYACISTANMKDGIPYLFNLELLWYVWHEFAHSFVNPLTDQYADKVASLNQLFRPIRRAMSRQAYGTWETAVNEHIVRSIHIRLMELHIGYQQANLLLENDLRSGFIYIEPLIEKLKDFEKQRDKNNITFSEFYPELLKVLDNLQR